MYPNAGIIDAFMSVRRGDGQWSLQTSGIRPADKMKREVGPYKIEVVEPFRRLHLSSDDHELGFDLWFVSEYDPQREPQHVKYGGPTGKVILDGCRYAQVGTWEGELRVEGETIAVSPQRWTATRDRSWGIRPVGEPDPVGRPSDKEPGIWWIWVPLKFDDFGVHFMVEEDPDGFRTLNYAVRYWPTATGHKVEQLGWPDVDIRYRSGSRYPEGATLHLQTVDRKPPEIDIACLTGIPLHLGCGYGNEHRVEPRPLDGGSMASSRSPTTTPTRSCKRGPLRWHRPPGAGHLPGSDRLRNLRARHGRPPRPDRHGRPRGCRALTNTPLPLSGAAAGR